MGTRFIATAECTAPADYKQAILDADEDDIVLTERITGVPVSVIRTPYIEKMGTKAGPIGRWMLKGRKTKHWMRMIYSLQSLWKLKRSVRGRFSYKDYLQAGKSVAGSRRSSRRRRSCGGSGRRRRGRRRREPPGSDRAEPHRVWIIGRIRSDRVRLCSVLPAVLALPSARLSRGLRRRPLRRPRRRLGPRLHLLERARAGELLLPGDHRRRGRAVRLSTATAISTPSWSRGIRWAASPGFPSGSPAAPVPRADRAPVPERSAPRFVDVTEASGIRATGYGMGAATGDFDNDGRAGSLPRQLRLQPALAEQRRRHVRGRDARRPASTIPAGAPSATFADLDRDGWLDLFVLNYVDFTVENNVRLLRAEQPARLLRPLDLPAGRRAACCATEATARSRTSPLRSGIGRKPGPGLGVVAADLDGDGWQDLFVANDGRQLPLDQPEGLHLPRGRAPLRRGRQRRRPARGGHGDRRWGLRRRRRRRPPRHPPDGGDEHVLRQPGRRPVRGRHGAVRPRRAEPALHRLRHGLARRGQRRLARPRRLQRRRQPGRRHGLGRGARPLRPAGPALPQPGRRQVRGRERAKPAPRSGRRRSPGAPPSGTWTTTATRTSSSWTPTPRSAC